MGGRRGAAEQEQRGKSEQPAEEFRFMGRDFREGYRTRLMRAAECENCVRPGQRKLAVIGSNTYRWSSNTFFIHDSARHH